MDVTQLTAVAKALAHPARIRIVRLLAEQTECRGADVFAGLPLAQSTISAHLRVLKRAGVVNSSPVGTAMVYCLDRDVLEAFADCVAALVARVPACRSSVC